MNLNYFTGDWNADCGIMYEMLEGIDFYSGSERKRMLKHKNDGSVGSMNYGFTWKGYLKKDKETGEKIFRKKAPLKGFYETKIMEQYPELRWVFEEFKDLYFSDFCFTNVQMNKNFPCPPHKDGANVGESVLVCLGEYGGGELVIKDYPELGENVIDTRNSIYRFNGSLFEHWVKPFEGTRYSLVFYNNSTIRGSLNNLIKNMTI